MNGSSLVFGLPSTAISLTAMIICYILLFTEKFNRAVITMFLASLLVIMGVISQSLAIKAIDFNTMALLTGMMIIINIAEKTGLFQYVAIWGAKKVRGHPLGILLVLGGVTAVFSAFLDNVTTVLLIVPVTLEITKKLKVAPYPYLILNIFTSNIGGTATLIGDPPNILIGSALNLSFTDFLFHLTPVVLVILAVVSAIFFVFWRPLLKTNLKNRVYILNMKEKEAITDYTLLYKCLAVLFAVITGFILAEHLHLANGFIALLGAAVILLLYATHLKKHEANDAIEDVLSHVDWTTIFFFIGLFVMVGALEASGFLHIAGDYFVDLTGGSIKKSVYIILSVSALFSALIDNIPFVATMIPMLKSMEESLGGREVMMPVWWALSLGACLGGNGTLIGASANVIVAGIAAREGSPISFMRYLLWSIPITVISVIIAGIFLYLEYFI